MKISANTGHISKNLGLASAIDMFSAAGFDALDFSATAEEFYTDAHDKQYYLEMKRYAEDKGLYFNQAHAPYHSGFTDEERTKRRFGEITVAMRNAAYLGATDIVVHPMTYLDYAVKGVPEQLFEMNMDFYRRLIPYSEEYGIRIAVEKMWLEHGEVIGHCVCSRAEEFVRYIDCLASDRIVACLDIGHSALVRENPAEAIRTLGSDRLKCLHVHDVDGFHDNHTLPFYGIVSWDDVMGALAEVGYAGVLTFEVNCRYKNLPMELWGGCLGFLAQIGRNLCGRFDGYSK